MDEKSTVNKQILAVVIHDKQVDLTFSNISQISSPEEALNTFVVELTRAVEAIRDLRQIQKNTVDQAKKGELIAPIGEIVKTLGNWQYAMREYSIECASVKSRSEERTTLTQEQQIQIRFVEYVGPIIREISVPISSLKVYWEIISLSAKNEGNQEKYLDVVDNVLIPQIFKFLENVEEYRL